MIPYPHGWKQLFPWLVPLTFIAMRYINKVMYILFAFLYALIISFHKIFKKKSVAQSSTIAVLCLFTTTALICALTEIGTAVMIDFQHLPLIILEGLLSSISWLCITASLKRLELSITSFIQTFSMVLSFFCGIFVFHETVTIRQTIGVIMVFAGVFITSLIEICTTKKDKQVALFPIILVMISTICSFLTSLINKHLLQLITAPQNQFWYLLTTCAAMWIMVLAVKLFRKTNLIHRADFKNFWAYLAGIFLFVGDLCLFIAYNFTDSKLTVITIISKFSMVVIFLVGLLWLKEKKSWSKTLLLLCILTGIILVSV